MATITITDIMHNETTLEDILADYPEAVAYDAGGFQLDLTVADPWEAADVRGGRVALIWADEESSEGDDGVNAIAQVTEAAR